MQECLFKMSRIVGASRIAGSALLISILPAVVAGQARPVVSNQLAISQTEAALHLEFSGDGTLEIVLRDGSVMINGEDTGSFEPGDALDTAWRSLLGEIVSLSDGPLGEALRDWEAPSSLEDRALELAQLLDRTLEDALLSDDVSASADGEPAFVIDPTAPDLDLSLQELEDLSIRIRREIREELRSELRDELRRELRNVGEASRGYGPLRALGRGITDIVGNVITFLLLSLLALGAVYFAKDNLEVVADTAQRSPLAGWNGRTGRCLPGSARLGAGLCSARSVGGGHHRSALLGPALSSRGNAGSRARLFGRREKRR